MRHHVWCNGVNPLNPNQDVTQEELDACPWCGPSAAGGGLLKNYSREGLTEEELVKKFFPDVKRVK